MKIRLIILSSLLFSPVLAQAMQKNGEEGHVARFRIQELEIRQGIRRPFIPVETPPRTDDVVQRWDFEGERSHGATPILDATGDVEMRDVEEGEGTSADAGSDWSTPALLRTLPAPMQPFHTASFQAGDRVKYRPQIGALGVRYSFDETQRGRLPALKSSPSIEAGWTGVGTPAPRRGLLVREGAVALRQTLHAAPIRYGDGPNREARVSYGPPYLLGALGQPTSSVPNNLTALFPSDLPFPCRAFDGLGQYARSAPLTLPIASIVATFSESLEAGVPNGTNGISPLQPISPDPQPTDGDMQA